MSLLALRAVQRCTCAGLQNPVPESVLPPSPSLPKKGPQQRGPNQCTCRAVWRHQGSAGRVLDLRFARRRHNGLLGKFLGASLLLGALAPAGQCIAAVHPRCGGERPRGLLPAGRRATTTGGRPPFRRASQASFRPQEEATTPAPSRLKPPSCASGRLPTVNPPCLPGSQAPRRSRRGLPTPALC